MMGKTSALVLLLGTAFIGQDALAQKRVIEVHDHRRGPRAKRERAAFPTQAPPAARGERRKARAGFVWQAGRYDWRDGAYVWIDGHWEREQRGRRWVDGRWQQQGDRWVWNDGSWEVVAVAEYPTAPPPEPRVEKPKRRRGYVWVDGYYQWQDGAYVWVNGHLERKSGKRWRRARWERTGDRYVFVDGSWEAAPDYPTEPPPPAPVEQPAPRAGFLWVAGHYDWRDGSYVWTAGHWERQSGGQHWEDGHWEREGDRYVWHPGTWVRD